MDQDAVESIYGCKALWAAVFLRTVKDLSLDPSDIKNRMDYATAVNWFRNDAQGTGSFLWVCKVLNMHPEQIRNRIQAMLRARMEKHKKMIRARAGRMLAAEIAAVVEKVGREAQRTERFVENMMG